MKYQPHHQPLETEGFQETATFTIAATGKAFRNLMDSQYSRKIEAVVREICTNALDSHIEAGYPHRRFKVSLPTTIRPLFTVRDYGTGMSHEKVMTFYSVLFRSSKDRSNKQNGMLGIGRMSPMAYTDGFTLQCYDGREARVYSLYLGEGGVPQVSYAGSRLCDEPRGVEVSLPVKADDFKSFSKAVVRVLKGFPFPPEGLPREVYQRLIPQVRFSGDGWAILDSSEENFLETNESHVYALQGCVLYPVQMHHVDPKLGTIKDLVVLDFPIGELQFTPGRETLQYDERTVKNLQKRWRKFISELDVEIEKDFAGCSTDWEIAVRAEKNGRGLSLFSQSRFAKIAQRINNEIYSLVSEDRWDEENKDRPFVLYVTRQHYTDGRGYHDVVSEFSWRSRSRMSRPSSCVTYSRKTGEVVPVLFAMEDPEVRDFRRRISHYMTENGYKYLFLLKKSHFQSRRALRHWAGRAQARCFHTGAPMWTVRDFDWSKLGNPPLLSLRDLPDPPRPTYDRSERDPPSYNRFLKIAMDGRGRPHIVKTFEYVPDVSRDVFAFVRDNEEVVRPHAKLPVSEWARVSSVSELMSLYAMTRRDKDPPLVLVRMRRNEVYRRWRDHRLFATTLRSAIRDATKAEIVHMTNVVNMQRFKCTRYGEFLSIFRKLASDNRVRCGEILDLERFEKRYKRIPLKLRSRLEELCSGMGHAEEIVWLDRARSLGLEILPDLNSRMDDFVYPVLPERILRVASDAVHLWTITPLSPGRGQTARDRISWHDRIRKRLVAKHVRRELGI